MAAPPAPSITIDGTAYRIVDGRPEHLPPGRTSYVRMTSRELLAHHRDGELWAWLRAHGVRRPSPSGRVSPGYVQPPPRRRTVPMQLSLSPEVAGEIRRRAEAAGLTISAYVARELGLADFR